MAILECYLPAHCLVPLRCIAINYSGGRSNSWHLQTMFNSLSSLILFGSVFKTVAAMQTCYFPSGDIAGTNVPCSNTTEHTWCCGSVNSCLANGLCLANDDAYTAWFARGSCTDPRWSSPYCFPECTTNCKLNRLADAC